MMMMMITFSNGINHSVATAISVEDRCVISLICCCLQFTALFDETLCSMSAEIGRNPLSCLNFPFKNLCAHLYALQADIL